MRNAFTILVFAIFVFLGAAASARPPATESKRQGTGDGPEVGRLRMRDRIVPLTRANLAEGGAARELKEAFAADIMADIDHDHREHADSREKR